jgi:hypothetical protein
MSHEGIHCLGKVRLESRGAANAGFMQVSQRGNQSRAIDIYEAEESRVLTLSPEYKTRGGFPSVECDETIFRIERPSPQ